jgi:hypothetical protein
MHWLWTAATLATAVAGAAHEVVTTPRQFEVDIVFPHNDTYKPTDAMPIVFAIQNATVPQSIGNFQLGWQIMHYQGGHFNESTTSQVAFGGMVVHANETPPVDPTLFLVDFTNVTHWVRWGRPVPPATEYTPAADDRYLLQWSITWTGLLGNCTKAEASVSARVLARGALMFNVQTVRGKEDGSGWQGAIRDVQKEPMPECPEFGAHVQIGPALNASKPECPAFELLEGNRQGNPCAVKVDQAAASSISSRVSSSVSSYVSKYFPPATATPPVVASSTSKGGVGPAGTVQAVQTALAAACVLCGLAL